MIDKKEYWKINKELSELIALQSSLINFKAHVEKDYIINRVIYTSNDIKNALVKDGIFVAYTDKLKTFSSFSGFKSDIKTFYLSIEIYSSLNMTPYFYLLYTPIKKLKILTMQIFMHENLDKLTSEEFDFIVKKYFIQVFSSGLIYY